MNKKKNSPISGRYAPEGTGEYLPYVLKVVKGYRESKSKSVFIRVHLWLDIFKSGRDPSCCALRMT